MRFTAALAQLSEPFRYKGPASGRTRFRSILSLTWPQMALLCCQFIIGITDVWAAGQIDSTVQASIGLITQCQMLLMALAMAAMSGTVATVSQSLGAKRYDRARRYIGLTLGAGIGLSLILALTGYALRDEFLRMVLTPPEIHDMASMFLIVTLWSLPGHYGMTLGGAVFRAAKKVMMPLYVGMATCLINVVGDLGFGLGWWGFPNYGPTGIAWSTFAAVTFGSLVYLGMLLQEKLITRQSLPRWCWIKKGAPYLFKVAGPALGTSALWQSGYLVLFIITASLPFESVNALAGLTSGLRVEALIFMPAVAMNMTVSILVGHSLGAGQVAEARRVALVVVSAGCALMTLVAMGLWPLREILAMAIAPDAAVSQVTKNYLSYNFLSAPFTVASVVLAGAFNGAGATIYPLLAFSTAVWLVRLPVAWLFGHVLWQSADGVFLGMLISQIVQSSMLFWVFFYCDWTRFSMRAKRG